MTPPILHRFDRWARNALPVALSLTLALFTVVPFGIPHLAKVVPALNLVAIFYWSIWRPDLLPPVAVFLVGLIQDIVGGVPLGLNAFVFLLVNGVTVQQRTVFIGKPFIMTWGGFALVGGSAMTLQWIAMCLLNLALIGPKPMLFQLLLTLALFPAVALALNGLQRAVYRDST